MAGLLDGFAAMLAKHLIDELFGRFGPASAECCNQAEAGPPLDDPAPCNWAPLPDGIGTFYPVMVLPGPTFGWEAASSFMAKLARAMMAEATRGPA